jgi:hypothetical protein
LSRPRDQGIVDSIFQLFFLSDLIRKALINDLTSAGMSILQPSFYSGMRFLWSGISKSS